ncbi:MAG: DUF4190 domain-containing protein [Thermoleophilaceae bacterium]|nr:DUF4190 domain-containing protein [Thermoleophilaceae bacterium]
MPAAQAGSTNGLAVAALVLGILAIIFGIFVAPLGIILGIIGIVLGVMARNAVKRDPSIGRGGMATAGLITSVVGVVIGIIIIVIAIAFTASVVNQLENDPDFQQQLEQLTVPSQ